LAELAFVHERLTDTHGTAVAVNGGVSKPFAGIIAIGSIASGAVVPDSRDAGAVDSSREGWALTFGSTPKNSLTESRKPSGAALVLPASIAAVASTNRTTIVRPIMPTFDVKVPGLLLRAEPFSLPFAITCLSSTENFRISRLLRGLCSAF
jgi:hypothetical protein